VALGKRLLVLIEAAAGKQLASSGSSEVLSKLMAAGSWNQAAHGVPPSKRRH